MSVAHARHEPVEREDPRNVLLDEIATQIVAGIDAAKRNDVLEPLLARIKAESPVLARILAEVTPAKAVFVPPAPAEIDFVQR